jgi:hypothetical protein
MPPGKKPNIIIILVDDMGFDDIAMHHPEVRPNGEPRYLSTPNLDRLMRMSKEFRNFYVTPMCSQSRAELLTGRDYIRTGTLLVNGEFGCSAVLLCCSLIFSWCPIWVPIGCKFGTYASGANLLIPHTRLMNINYLPAVSFN